MRVKIVGILFLLSFSLTVESKINRYDDVCPDIQAQMRSGSEAIKARAISLKILQRTLRKCHSSQRCDSKIYRLYGITKILGFIIDRDNNDLIIYGSVERNRSALYLEDFIVSLRNAYLKYAKRRGNTIYYSPPAVSIDPRPKTMLQLDKIRQKMTRAGTQQDRYIGQYRKVCEQLQDVRILGIPFNSHSGQVMLRSDYVMKSITNGSYQLKIAGFKSVTKLRYEFVAKQIRHGKRNAYIPSSSQDRYWFFPGVHSFRVSANKINYLVSKSSVVLLTANQFMTQSGGLKDSPRRSPFAEQFATCFGRRYAQIAAKLPIYRELAALYRQTAVTKLIRTVKGFKRSGLRPRYLLSSLVFKPIKVARTVPGICRIQKLPLHNNKKQAVGTLSSQSCGGVSMDIEVKPKKIKQDNTGSLKKATQKILKSRPTSKSLQWDMKVTVPR